MRISMAPYETNRMAGGVMNCTYNLIRELTKLGHQVTSENLPGMLRHAHAFDRSDNVYTSHGIYPRNHAQAQYNVELIESIARADIITAVSNWTASNIAFACKDVRIINNGINLDDLNKFKRKEAGYILWGKGTADEVSNPVPYIKLASAYPHLQFLMTVTPGNINLPPNLKIIGQQSYEEMMRYVAGARILVSTGWENFPIQPLEAAALGVPVIALPLGGVPEVKTIHCSENLEALLDEALANRDRWSKEGLDIVKQEYQWSKIAKQYLKIYEEALEIRHTERISVVIPCYNLADKVGRAVESVLAQTLPPDEIIVVDDGSSDSPDKALDKYKGKIKLVRQKNAGVSVARNNGIAQATGEYICCLDADDALSTDFLELTKAVLSRDTTIGLAYTGMRVLDTQGRFINDFPGEYHPSLANLARGNFIPCANLFRKKVWKRAGGYKKINPSWEDYDLWLSILEAGFEAKHAPIARLLYTQSDSGRTGQEQRENHSKLLRATVDGFHPRLYGGNGTVTFVIPCYNQWQYVRDAVESAFGQTYPHIEVILVDDASAHDKPYPHTEAELMREFPRLQIIQHRNNEGLSAARNTGIKAATTEWVVPLDADDKVDPNFVAECMKVVYNTESYAYTDVWTWHNEGQGPTVRLDMPTFDPDRLRTNHQHPCTILMKRSWVAAINGYDEDMRDGWEDYEFAIRMVKSGHCGVRIPQPLFYYRWRENSMRQLADEKQQQLNDYIWSRHDDVVRGRSLMSCCGGNNTPLVVNNNNPVNQGEIFVPEGMVLIQYTGNKAGDMTKIGGQNRIYRYNSIEPRLLVHQDDLMLFTSPTFVLVQTIQVTPEPVMPAEEIIAQMPEGNDDFKLIEGITPDLEIAIKQTGTNTYQRLMVMPEDDLISLVGKKQAKKVKMAAMTMIQKEMGV